MVARRILGPRTNDGPLRMRAAGGKGETPGQTPSARGGAGRVPRREGRRGQGERIIAPNVDLTLLRQTGNNPLMLAQDGIDPGACSTALGQDFGDAGENV